MILLLAVTTESILLVLLLKRLVISLLLRSTGLSALKAESRSILAAASQITTETANDGSGNVVSARNITAGSSITVYAVTRDQYGNFVANAPGIWSLTNGTGGVVDGDLVPASDKKSALFTGHLPGTANIRVTSGSLTSTDSGLLTVTPEINSNT